MVKPPTPFSAKSPTDQGCQNKGNISQVPKNRHEDIGIAVGLVGRFKELVIDPIKILNAFSFMHKGLDHFLTRHHFFNKAVLNPQVLLLGPKVTT